MKVENEKTVEEIKIAFEQIDAIHDGKAPSVPVLAAMLAEKKRIYRRELKRDLGIFLSVSFVLAALLVALLWKAPAVYLAVQALGFVAIFVYVYRQKKSRHKEGRPS